MFIALELSLQVLELLVPIEEKLRRHRKSLADEVGRAAESIALNLAEGSRRAGLDRTNFYRLASGSAAELSTALRIASARGLIGAGELAAINVPLDQVRAITWRMTHPKAER